MKASDILDTSTPSAPDSGYSPGPRPPSGTEHHVVKREPHGEILVAVLGPYRVMALPSCSPLRGAGSLGGEVLSRKAKKPANMQPGERNWFRSQLLLFTAVAAYDQSLREAARCDFCLG
jgi:hypothetical protein